MEVDGTETSTTWVCSCVNLNSKNPPARRKISPPRPVSFGSELRAAAGASLRVSSDGCAHDVASVGARAGQEVEDAAIGALVDDLLRKADADVLWSPISW